MVSIRNKKRQYINRVNYKKDIKLLKIEEMRAVMKNHEFLNKEIYLISLCKFIVALGNFIIPFLSFYLITKEHLSESLTGLIVTLVSVSYIPSVILGGKLSKFNLKKTIVTCYICSSISYFLVIFSEDLFLKLTLIFIGRFTLTLTEPLLNVIINNSSNSEKKMAFSLPYLAMNLGYAVGPIIAGNLFDSYINYIYILDSLSKLIVSMLLIVYYKERSELAVEKHEVDSLKYSEFLKAYPDLLFFSIIILIYNFIYAQSSFTLSVFLNSVFNDKAVEYYGYLMTSNALTIIFCTTFIAKLTNTINPLKCIIIAGILFCVGFGGYYFVINLYTSIVCTIIWSLGEIMFFTNILVYLSNRCNNKFFGLASSIVNAISRIGMYINPLIIGVLINYIIIRNVWIIASIIILIATLLLYIYYNNELSVKDRSINIEHEF